MADPSIKKRLIVLVAECLDVAEDSVTLGSSFEKDLGADSLDVLNLIIEIEEEFSINIPDDEAMGIHTVEQALDCIIVAKKAPRVS